MVLKRDAALNVDSTLESKILKMIKSLELKKSELQDEIRRSDW